MDAASIIADWKRRLIELAHNPEYVYRDTPADLVERHRQRLTTFSGYSEQEIVTAEVKLGVRFPVVFRTFLREMAKSPGDLFRGSSLASINEFDEFRQFAAELLTEIDPGLRLPPDCVVFLEHQGYTFLFFTGTAEFDAPVMQWVEGNPEPTQAAQSFAVFVDAELRLAERNNGAFRESGGYYLTLFPDGGQREDHPARASGKRPLDQIVR